MRSKFLFILFTIASIVFLSQQPVSAQFSDVPVDDPHATAIRYLNDLDILRGQGDAYELRPQQLLNRAEWATILVRQANADSAATEYALCFPDVAVEWFAGAVCYAKEQGWVKGYQAGPEAGKFMPVNPLVAAEVLVTLQRIFNWTVTEGGYWYSGAYEYAKSAKLIDESMAFDHQLTRAEAAEILFRALALVHFGVRQYDPLLAELLLNDTVQPQPTPSEPVTPNPVNARRVYLTTFPDQPPTTTLAIGALYVPVIRFQLEAEQTVTLRSLAVRRISVGRTQDLLKARLLINGKVIQENPFSSADESVTWQQLNLQLNPGEQFLIEMNVDFRTTALPSLVYQFKVTPEGLSFNEENVIVEGSELQGDFFRIGPIPATTVTISNPKSALKPPFVDSEGQIIGRFVITAGEHDVVLKRLRLEDAEQVNPITFKNFRLTAGSDEIASLETIHQNVLDFTVRDYLIEAGRSRTLTVMADILDAGIDDAIRLYLDRPEDIHAFDLQYGFGAQIKSEFSIETAKCVGSETITCPAEGLRKHCSKEDREREIRDCEVE